MTPYDDVMVIGGGQAGLAAGHLLARQGCRFVILEAAGEPAASWRSRWDSLRLFTPARYDSLPGAPFPGDPDHYPTHDEVVAYLTDYAPGLPIQYRRPVNGAASDRRRIPRRGGRPRAPSTSGRGRDRAVPGSPQAAARHRARRRHRSAAQQRLP